MMRVRVYRNLRNKCYSVVSTKTGRVVARQTALTIRGATFVVREAGRQRVLATGVKNVHAFVVGEWDAYSYIPSRAVRVSYNPFKAGFFYRTQDGSPVEQASRVHLLPDGLYAYGEV